MPISASGAVEAPLLVFGSWVTDVSPDALPEGVSPDNQEVAYRPGGVESRSAFQADPVISFPSVGGIVPTCVYGKSFVTPTGDVKNLYLDSAGRIWVRDMTNSPGTVTLLVSSIAGSFGQSITAFGREYIALSDGLHGTEVPLQYDGTNVDRVTMDGPGSPPAVSSLQLPAVNMAASGNTLARLNNQVLCATATAHKLTVGYQAQIANVPDSNATTVNQTQSSASQVVNASVWNFNSGQYRSLFNPGTSMLSDFVAEGFGFSIPSNASILGVAIGFGLNSQASTTGTVAAVALWYTGAQEGTSKTPGTAITTTITTETYGGAADVWGAALTPSVVNDPSFGFAVSITCDSIRVFLNFPFTITVYYTLSGSGTVAQVSTIVINNEVAPGLALVTTDEPHGLSPRIPVSIVGVEPAAVGGGVSAGRWSAGKTTITTVSSHKLNPGAVVQLASMTTATGSTTFSFNGNFTILEVPSPNQFTYYQTPITAADPDVINATASTGTVSVAWPIPDDTPTPTYFEVDSCPTPTTFYVAVNYADGAWTTGSVGFIWQGTFYVTHVVDSKHFYYFNPGPNGATTAVGTVTPFGQCAPGLHLCQVLWLTRQGAIPAPSPPTTFIANGGQYVSVTNIPIGPPNVIARILAFTGAQPDVPGELPPFFYIPTVAELEGQIVSTSTVIYDNTTTSAVLDFSDNTLYAATGISIPGNKLANQIVLDGALGFRTYLSRLIAYGQRNCIQNLLNLGFEGGYDPAPPNPWGTTTPLGWTVNPTYGSSGTLVNDHFGMAWQITVGSAQQQYGVITQSGYLDAYGAPIFVGNQTFTIRFWARTNGNSATSPIQAYFQLQAPSVSLNLLAIATIANSTTGAWYEATFTALPTAIPSDLIFAASVNSSSTAGLTVTLDDIQVIFSESPYLDQVGFASYVNNPEGMDGDTGQTGPRDTAKIMDFAIVRSALCCLTQAPDGKLHVTNGSTVTEPSGWDWEPIQGSCGALSAFGSTRMPDDSTTASGDDWLAWASDVGAMIYGGGLAAKISQEIQPNWNDANSASPQIKMSSATTAWVANDPVERLIYFGLPIGTSSTPSQIYVLNHQHLGNSEAIAGSPPFHPSFAGKLIATDNSRKWTRWIRAMNGAQRMYGTDGALHMTFFNGNGLALGTGGYGHVYTLNPARYTDDDYGQINPYYVTYFFLDPEKRQMMQLKGGRLLLAYVLAQIQPPGTLATSQVTLSYLCDQLANVWPLSTTRALTLGFSKDRNFGGGMAQGERITIKIASSPNSGTDNGFVCTRLSAWFRNARLRVTGVNQ